jgi:hypothetical protein
LSLLAKCDEEQKASNPLVDDQVFVAEAINSVLQQFWLLNADLYPAVLLRNKWPFLTFEKRYTWIKLFPNCDSKF